MFSDATATHGPRRNTSNASDTAEGDWFGTAVSLSGPGDALAVGANNPFNGGAGAVYVFTKSGSTWSQQG